jgi:exosortase A-associated hydrolase 2
LLQAFFLNVEPGQRFCVLHTPTANQQPSGCVVYVHPFAEEMNKSRRMAALQARRLATQGFAVLQMDLYGCGDSTGGFGQAHWDAWKRDIAAAATWLLQRYRVPLTLWGLRLGALLAADLAHDSPLGVDRLLMWQPVVDGAQFLSQFLRLRLANQMLTTGSASTAIRDLTEALRRGEAQEIAGYELNPQLAASLQQRNMETLTPAVRQVDWLEVAVNRGLPLKPASQRVLDAWGRQGIATALAQVSGEPFWSSLDIIECVELLELTTAAMQRTA